MLLKGLYSLGCRRHRLMLLHVFVTCCYETCSDQLPANSSDLYCQDIRFRSGQWFLWGFALLSSFVKANDGITKVTTSLLLLTAISLLEIGHQQIHECMTKIPSIYVLVATSLSCSYSIKCRTRTHTVSSVLPLSKVLTYLKLLSFIRRVEVEPSFWNTNRPWDPSIQWLSVGFLLAGKTAGEWS